MKSTAYFAAKESAILAAIARVQALIQKYLTELFSWAHDWDFNLLHDLEYRLEQRLRAVRAAFTDYHFERYDWAVLN